ncbi:hypothetical protein DMR_09610 [Solidesulfovibrio magneticus RS-1]|uniref:Uncharacterized protein n=1 Tax=Solidesulfovibrio magneticus (strain ATCC 700980 / DSM 13731 / RS-1) TaxID=573370 RepID=C4XKR3_SOLM1|nr:hypothetical protein DMR_09610 [Solidesulfovibrio magneticus RS-1]
MLQDQGQASFSDVSTITGLKNRRVLRISIAFFWSEEASTAVVIDPAPTGKIYTPPLQTKNSSKLDLSKVVDVADFFVANS